MVMLIILDTAEDIMKAATVCLSVSESKTCRRI